MTSDGHISPPRTYIIYTVFILLFSVLPSLDSEGDSLQHGGARLSCSRSGPRAVGLVNSCGHANPECCLLITADKSSQLALPANTLGLSLISVYNLEGVCVFSSKVLWGIHIRAGDVISDYNVLSGTGCIASAFVH